MTPSARAAFSSDEEFRDVARHGARWCVEHGDGWSEDLDRAGLSA